MVKMFFPREGTGQSRTNCAHGRPSPGSCTARALARNSGWWLVTLDCMTAWCGHTHHEGTCQHQQHQQQLFLRNEDSNAPPNKLWTHPQANLWSRSPLFPCLQKVKLHALQLPRRRLRSWLWTGGFLHTKKVGRKGGSRLRKCRKLPVRSNSWSTTSCQWDVRDCGTAGGWLLQMGPAGSWSVRMVRGWARSCGDHSGTLGRRKGDWEPPGYTVMALWTGYEMARFLVPAAALCFPGQGLHPPYATAAIHRHPFLRHLLGDDLRELLPYSGQWKNFKRLLHVDSRPLLTSLFLA